MTNFKVGQKVVCIENIADLSKDEIYTINDIRTISSFGRIKCVNCGNTDSVLIISESSYTAFCTCVFRPLSYSSNVNMEVISLFQPTEERQDLKPQPKKIEA